MKRVLLLFVVWLSVLSVNSQVVNLQFKIDNSSLAIKFMNTGERDLDSIKVDYYVINLVDKIVYSLSSTVNTDGVEVVKPMEAGFKGPFKAGKTYRRSKYILNLGRSDVSPFPCKLSLMYKGSLKWVDIPINAENIATFYPTLRWREINNTMDYFRQKY